MDDECIEVIDLAGPEDKSDINTKVYNIKNREVDHSDSEPFHDIQSSVKIVKNRTLLHAKTKKICRQGSHRRNKHKTESQEENRDYIQTKSQSISSNNTIINDFSNKTINFGDKEVQSDYSKKRCTRKKNNKSLQDDTSVIFSNHSVPKPIISKSNTKKKRKVIYSPVNDYNIQSLVISLDVKVRHKKYNHVVHARSNKNKHKMQPCTVPMERILPNCFRKTCCHNSNNLKKIMCTKNDSKRNTKDSLPRKQNMSKNRHQQKNCVTTKTSRTKYSDFMYEDISQGSFESDEEIDVLIKRTRERERKGTNSVSKTNETKLFQSSTYGFSDYSDILSDSGHSGDDKTASIHSQVTLVLGEPIYTPTQFSPLETSSIDFEPMEYEKDMSLNTYFTLPATLQHFNGYSKTDNEIDNQFQAEKNSKDQKVGNGIEVKNDVPLIKTEVFEMDDNDVIDTALLCLPQNVKTENLDVMNDIYVIKT